MSHEGVIYCKPHHRELFQPKVVKDDIVDVSGKKKKNQKPSFTEEAIGNTRTITIYVVKQYFNLDLSF